LVEAHAVGCQRAQEFHQVHLPQKADIVVVDGYPFDIEFWQVNKALDTAGAVVRQGGVVICVSPCYEGLSQTHEQELLKYGYQSKERVKQLVASGEISHKVIGVHMIQVSHVTAVTAEIFLVTDGIPDEEVEMLGLRYAASPQGALDKAMEITGHNASVIVLRDAAEMLSLCKVSG
jgi:nickel-dependent lactate racemase